MAVDNTKISALITALDARYINEGALDSALNEKVDKVTGKGLSTNDLTDALKTKLDNIEEGANAYVHPDSTQTAVASGLYKIATDSKGHITGATAVAKADITGLGIPAQDTTYSEATTTTAGLMSAEDKTALDGLADAGAVTIAKDTNVTGNVARYTFSQGGNTLPTTIDIPTDMVVQSGQIVVNPTGQPAGTYIELTIANQSEPIYINVADLVDAYTADNSTLAMSNNQFAVKDAGITNAKLATEVSTQWKADADTEIEAYLTALTNQLNSSS